MKGRGLSTRPRVWALPAAVRRAQHRVCVPTTPAQVYHMLRRQAIRPLRKPLVALTPVAVAPQAGHLDPGRADSGLLPDGDSGDRSDRSGQGRARHHACSGKVYYDLLDKRRAEGRDDIAIVRIEQLYPFPEEDLAEALAPYQNVKHIIWCQEEPMNRAPGTAASTTCAVLRPHTRRNCSFSMRVVMHRRHRRSVTPRCMPSSRKTAAGRVHRLIHSARGRERSRPRCRNRINRTPE